MEISMGARLKHAWNAFFNKDPTRNYRDIGVGYSFRPDRMRFSRGNERSIVTSVYNRIAMDVAAVDMFHVRLDENNRFLATLDSGLKIALQLKPMQIRLGGHFFRMLSCL